MADIVSTSSTHNSISGTVRFDSTGSNKTAKLFYRRYDNGAGTWYLWSTYTANSLDYPFTIGGLFSSDHYQVSVDSYVDGVVVTYGSFIDIYTKAPPDPPPTPSGISASAQTGHYFYVNWNSSSGATDYQLEKSSDNSSWYTWDGSSSGYTGNTTSRNVNIDYEYQYYYFRVRAYNSYGTSGWVYTTSSGIKSRDEQAPSLTAFYYTDKQPNQIIVYMTGNDNNPTFGGTPSGILRFRLYQGGLLHGYANINGASNNGLVSAYYTFGSLTPKTPYNFDCYAEDYHGNLSAIMTVNETTPDNRPANWAWDADPTGSTEKTSGTNFNLKATEWNNFTAQINAFRVYKGLANATFTTATSGNQLTAIMFNESVNAISGMSPPIAAPAGQSSGNVIYASLLNGLRDSLNSIP